MSQLEKLDTRMSGSFDEVRKQRDEKNWRLPGVDPERRPVDLGFLD